MAKGLVALGSRHTQNDKLKENHFCAKEHFKMKAKFKN
jgi:hypothetical protein